MPSLSTQVCNYISALTISQGRRAGEPFEVLPWQRAFIRGFCKSGVRKSALSIARANGKTTLVAGIACAAFDGPLATPRSEVLIVASSFAQGTVAFNHARYFLGDKLEDRKRYRVHDSQNAARIEDRETGCMIRVLGNDPAKAHGLAPSLILMDEPAKWDATKAEKMLVALRTAAGKQRFCRSIALGTKPDSDLHWFTKWLNGKADFAKNYSAASEDDPFKVSTWRKANPSMAAMPDLAAELRAEALDAELDAAELYSFRALRLNMGTAEVERRVLLEGSTWMRIEGDAAAEGATVWGIDLGSNAAQSAIACYWPATGKLSVLAAFPSTPSLEERGRTDGVANLYRQCADAGELIQTGGEATDYKKLIELALERFGKPALAVADRWRAADLRDALRANSIRCTVDLRGQGFRDGAEDVRRFRRACLEQKVTPDKSLLMVAAITEARTVSDLAGNEKLAKGTEGGRRLMARDDAAAAAILAVSAGVRRRPRPRRIRRCDYMEAA